jgi:DNA helicase HerA-like ATPase
MIVSQRPAEIDPTILSQCGTFFALRLSNASDRSHVTGTLGAQDAAFRPRPRRRQAGRVARAAACSASATADTSALVA